MSKLIIGIVGRVNGSAGSAHQNIGELIQRFAQAVYDEGAIPMIEGDTAVAFIKGTEFHRKYAKDLKVASLDGLGMTADYVVVFGGDGTMVTTAKYLSKYKVSVLGVNLGRLGFITDVPSNSDFGSVVKMIQNGEFTTEKRLMLTTDAYHTPALNDIVISRAIGKILEFRVYLDDEYAYQARADGLMVSTPTGSTAYAMSAGGPIIHPSSKVFELVPMLPQTLSCRPLIVSKDTHVMFELIYGEAEIYSDGIKIRDIGPGDKVEIAVSIEQVKLIHPNGQGLDYSYYNTLREKLYWQHLPGTPR